MRILVLLSLTGLSACMTPAQSSDAASEAAAVAADRCKGRVALIKGTKGHSPDDYRCIEN
jgi:hypothetical protein